MSSVTSKPVKPFYNAEFIFTSRATGTVVFRLFEIDFKTVAAIEKRRAMYQACNSNYGVSVLVEGYGDLKVIS